MILEDGCGIVYVCRGLKTKIDCEECEFVFEYGPLVIG